MVDFLKRNKGTPCFINLWPDDVHTTWAGDFSEQAIFPEGEESEKNFRTVLIEYDRQMGRLIDGLKALGIAEQTIVIFTSDNGPAPDFCGSRSGNFRGCKATGNCLSMPTARMPRSTTSTTTRAKPTP